MGPNAMFAVLLLTMVVWDPWIAVRPLAAGTPKYVLHELESDLLGWHFWRTGRAPVFQYRTSRAIGDAAA